MNDPTQLSGNRLRNQLRLMMQACRAKLRLLDERFRLSAGMRAGPSSPIADEPEMMTPWPCRRTRKRQPLEGFYSGWIYLPSPLCLCRIA
jgi:hypothetical protein